MKPEDKRSVVEVLMSCGEHVAFCGDGANDMEALNAATIGVSLVSLFVLILFEYNLCDVAV
jgi:P-type E1-E2 ATPase